MYAQTLLGSGNDLTMKFSWIDGELALNNSMTMN